MYLRPLTSNRLASSMTNASSRWPMYCMMVFVLMPECSTLANVALILGGLVRAPMEEASTSTRSSSSCDLRSPLRETMSLR